MKNMTIRPRMLTCFTVAAAASLAFLTPCASLAAQPKSSIYGTPAQLVADLSAMGIDLANCAFPDSALLKKANLVQMPYGSESYQFTDAKLEFISETGKLENIELHWPPPPTEITLNGKTLRLAELPLGGLGKAMSGGAAGIAKRYGPGFVHASPRDYTQDPLLLVTAGKGGALWRFTFFDKPGEGWRMRGGLRSDDYSTVTAAQLAAPGTPANKYIRLLRDLDAAGISITGPSSKAKLIARGKLDKDKPSGAAREYSEYRDFRNGSVRIAKQTNIITFCLLDNGQNYRASESIRKFFAREIEWPLGELKDVMDGGLTEVKAAYGEPHKPQVYPPGASHLQYTLIVKNLSGPAFAATIHFADYREWCQVVYELLSRNVIILEQPALGKAK